MSTELNLEAASLDSYSPEDRAFYDFWYGHMWKDELPVPLNDLAYSTARYIWDAARHTVDTSVAPVSAPLDTQALPPPRNKASDFEGWAGVYTDHEVRRILAPYAERIRHLERELSEHKAARIAYASEFPPDADGEPDVGSIHANIRSLKRELAERKQSIDTPKFDSLLNKLVDAADLNVGTYHSARAALIAYIDGHTAGTAPAWQPIEGAPKDQEIWAFNGEQARMKWSEGDGWALWVWADELLQDADPSPDQPTHWMPLPSAPSSMSKGKEEAND